MFGNDGRLFRRINRKLSNGHCSVNMLIGAKSFALFRYRRHYLLLLFVPPLKGIMKKLNWFVTFEPWFDVTVNHLARFFLLSRVRLFKQKQVERFTKRYHHHHHHHYRHHHKECKVSFSHPMNLKNLLW